MLPTARGWSQCWYDEVEALHSNLLGGMKLETWHHKKERITKALGLPSRVSWVCVVNMVALASSWAATVLIITQVHICKTRWGTAKTTWKKANKPTGWPPQAVQPKRCVCRHPSFSGERGKWIREAGSKQLRTCARSWKVAIPNHTNLTKSPGPKGTKKTYMPPKHVAHFPKKKNKW
jgi:hypothetical protein